MTIKDLHKKLNDLKVPSDDYYLHGLYGSDSDDNKLGLTIKRAVNERLYATGLMDEFDTAKRKNKKRAAQILRILGVDYNSISKILSIILILLTVNNIFSQTTIVTGKIACYDKNVDCCFNCPQIWSQQDSMTITPNDNGFFRLYIDKRKGDFTLCISTIGAYAIWIQNIPYLDSVNFENIEIVYVNQISSSRYKRIERQTYREFESKVKARVYMSNNFDYIVPFGTHAYYFDFRKLPTGLISNPLDNSKMISIQNSDDKIIRIDYNKIKTK